MKAHWPPLTSKASPIRITVYVPNTTGSKIISADEHFKRASGIATKLRNMFGGTTNIEGKGTWLPEFGPPIKDNVFMITSFCSRTSWEKHKDKLLEYLMIKKKDWKQKQIAFVWEDMTGYYSYKGMHFI